jgi:molybdopterin-containing oxidoreductase family membrane subunit
LLAWDVIVLNGYLALNLAIPFYILFNHYRGIHPERKKYLPFMYIAVFWAVSIHLVTAFLLAGLPARPFWNTALLGPRFLASAFTAGPAFVIVLLWFIQSATRYPIGEGVLRKLAVITTVAAQINLVMLFSELFYKFYSPTHHGINARYLFFGLPGHRALVPWIWTAIGVNVVATLVLMTHPLRRNPRWLIPACAVLFIAVWIEKGLGLVIPGFIPSPLGEVVEYMPSLVELGVTAGIWATGLFVLTALVKVAIPIELGEARSPVISRIGQAPVIRPRAVRPQYTDRRPVRTR